MPPGQMRVWMCKWRDCDWQFETSDQLYDHITTVHTSQISKGFFFVVFFQSSIFCLFFQWKEAKISSFVCG